MTTQDVEHLRLLSIFHYVVAGIAALFSLFPSIHLAFGLLMVTGRLGGHADKPEEAVFGWFMVGFALVWIVMGLVFSACLFFAARYLQRRERYMFCLVMACLACLFAPFGTVLGVFTIIVLMRESVRAGFGVSTAT